MRRLLAVFAAASLATLGLVLAPHGGGTGADTGSLPLTVVSQSATTFTVSWTPATSAAGYVFKVDGVRVSNTWDGTRSRVTFWKQPGPPHRYEVVVVLEGEAGTVTLPQPPPATTAPAPSTTTSSPVPTGDLIPFGNFADGTVGGDFADTTQNCSSPHILVQRAGELNAATFTSDDSTQIPYIDGGGTRHVRVHCIAFKNGNPSWFANGHDVWRGLTVVVPIGANLTTYSTVTDEVHGDNGTGPAPFNLVFTRGGYFRLYVRGSTAAVPASGGYPFAQYIFGPNDGHDTYGGATYRLQQDWSDGGNKPVVPGEQVSFRFHWHLSTTDGSFEAWAYYDARWHYIVPLIKGIPTSYPDENGDGQAIYPILSSYYDVGSGRPNAVTFMAGAYSNDGATLAAFQDSELGISG